jgi:hypothetical protein
MKTYALTLSCILVACGAPAGGNTSPSLYQAADQSLESALELDDGGLREDTGMPVIPSDDAALADDDLAAAAEAPADSDVADVPAVPPEVTEVETQKGAFIVRLQWGNFPNNAANRNNPVDFSGDIDVSADDTIRRVRSWHFERKDQIQRPRDSKSEVAFTSVIGPASDGMHALIVTAEGATSLHVKLGAQFEKTFALDATTMRIREVDAAATAGLKVRIAIDRVKKRPSLNCDAGLIDGKWIKHTTGSGKEISVLVARLMAADGKVFAKIFGFAGEKKDGSHVFFMKAVGRGRLVGVAKGTYDPSAKTFSGTVYGPAKVERGTVSGTYADDGTFEGALELTACAE